MNRKLVESVRRLRAVTTLGLAIGLLGCSPEGTGTIKVEPGARARIAGGEAKPTKPVTGKQAKAKEVIDEAIKKNPKLQ